MCRGRFVLVFESESTLNKSVMCAKCEREVFNNTAPDDASKGGRRMSSIAEFISQCSTISKKSERENSN